MFLKVKASPIFEKWAAFYLYGRRTNLDGGSRGGARSGTQGERFLKNWQQSTYSGGSTKFAGERRGGARWRPRVEAALGDREEMASPLRMIPMARPNDARLRPPSYPTPRLSTGREGGLRYMVLTFVRGLPRWQGRDWRRAARYPSRSWPSQKHPWVRSR